MFKQSLIKQHRSMNGQAMSGNSMMQALERVDEGELFEYRMSNSS